MNGAQWHLLVVHLPVMITLCGVVLLIAGLARGEEALGKAAYGFFVGAGLFSIAAYYTGPAALEVLEAHVDVDPHYVEQHGVIGRASFVAGILLGVLALQCLLQHWQGSKPPRWVRMAVLLAALGTSYLGAWTAHLGGQIRHTEIRGSQLWIFPELPR